jgi:hypothetical protein
MSVFRKRAIALALGLAAAARAGPAFGACLNVGDPLQVLDFHLTIDPSDWNTILRDTSFNIERPAYFWCGDETPLLVSVRRKPTVAIPDEQNAVKVSLKIDLDEYVPDQEWNSHRKISLENGGGAVLVREGLSWLLMVRAGVITGNAAWVHLTVNGEPVGIYTRVEQIDKAFLRRHLGEDEYFLYDEGTLQTREGELDPYAAALCYQPFSSTCALPADGYASLHRDLNLPELMSEAVVNAFILNEDGLLAKENNHFWYNSPQPRLYFPWDLDTIFRQDAEGRDPHATAMRTSKWETMLLGDAGLRALFDTILLRLIGDPFHPDVLDRLIDDLTPAIGPAIDADPYNDLGRTFAAEAVFLRTWLRNRVAGVRAYLPPENPFPVVINELMASNRSTIRDETGEYADWVELYNRGAETVSLDGLYLSDAPATPRRWAFPPGTSIPPGGYLLVWCDNDVLQGPLHTGFRLEAGGETIGLYASDADLNRILDFVWFGPQRPDVSYGRSPDGSPGPRTSVRPTPGAANAVLLPGPGDVGPSLTVEPGPGSTITLRWQPSCSDLGQDYAIYEGQLRDWTSHTAIDCHDDLGDRSETVAASPGSTYYLLVPLDGAAEGSYGKTSAGAERPRGQQVCAPAQIVDSCIP